jgi:hypothetical protein
VIESQGLSRISFRCGDIDAAIALPSTRGVRSAYRMAGVVTFLHDITRSTPWIHKRNPIRKSQHRGLTFRLVFTNRGC